MIFTLVDYIALSFFAGCWLFYHLWVEHMRTGRSSLNTRMNIYRTRWIEELAKRENRVVDTTIMASLQNGTAFFASSSLIAVGGALALVKTADTVLVLFQDLPFAAPMSKTMWEVKVIGLCIIFVYAFFKFAWAYRIFNYAAILVGCVPVKTPFDAPETQASIARAAQMTISAGRHFNRGQRAFFFALAYLGWLIGPLVFLVTTAAVMGVMWQRQFISDACQALDD
jgi:uncharacterized membrane protein